MNHYVYQITNKMDGKYYIGVRSCEIDPGDDIGVKYFSSSKDKTFQNDQRNNPQYYLYEVIEKFETRELANKLEEVIHKRLCVSNDEMSYNLCNAPNNFNFSGRIHSDKTKIKMSNAHKGKTLSKIHKKNIKNSHIGKRLSEKTKTKISRSHFGLKHSDDTKFKLRQINLGKNHSNETKIKMSNIRIGMKLSDETKRKISISLTAVSKSDIHRKRISETLKNNPKIICPWCKKIGDVSNMKRWHFSNCKFKGL